MKLNIDPITGDMTVTFNLSDENGAGETRQVFIADDNRTRQGDENSRVVAIALVAIQQQLERIADALEAGVTAPPPKSRVKGANDG